MGNPRKANGARRRHVVRWLRSQGRPCWICGLPIDYGVPPGNPGAFECDELVPVSRGGSPFDRDNVAAAHRCCNNWRRARSVAEVSAVRSALAARRAAWNSPETFVALCKALKDDRASVIGPPSVPDKQPRATTSW
uniref:HNH endonuclease, GmR87, NESG, Structural Genomics.6A n=1 Tax=Siphoviridae sp. ctPrm3 TaxID=2827864 RepID=A0A8S5TPA6_9CAUD|nr:MAG TPA: HNH endonuclease, GmR87, NESG, Structural Genomics.6A [Siphoviridae sp. ctPrm3]